MAVPVVETQGLGKRYGSLTALKELTLTIEEGSIYGFIGPNGAGKTTTLKILATLLLPSRGTAKICGVDLREGPAKIRPLVGYMPDFFGVYDDMKVWEYMDFFGAAFKLPREKRLASMEGLLALVNLEDKRNDYVESLSRGMKQRLCLARALIHDPALLILDEPASGLDPRARVEMRELLKELKQMGKTIIVSSHILPELSELCTHIGIIERDDFPWTVAEPLVEAGWGNALVDATPLYAAIRQPADPAEIGLAQHAAGMAGKALDALPSNAGKASQSLAAIEASARCDGAEEVLVRIAPDLTKSAVLQRIEEDAVLGARYAVQLSLAYKGVWVRLVRCVSSGAAPVSWEAARRWLADAATRMTAANVASGPQGSAPGEVAAWSVEACLGNEPLTVIAHGGSGSARTSVSRSLPAGALGVLNVQLLTKDGPWHGSVPFVLGAQGASTKLLA